MRLSVNKSDPGYRDDIFSLDIEVFCDDVLVENCVTADEEEGFATFLTGTKNGYECDTATVRGKVEIRGL